MKKEAKYVVLTLQPVSKTTVTVRARNDRNNALVVGFTADVSLYPPMVMAGSVG